jgi:hypothetical protein
MPTRIQQMMLNCRVRDLAAMGAQMRAHRVA